jgi:hypothetical protein
MKLDGRHDHDVCFLAAPSARVLATANATTRGLRPSPKHESLKCELVEVERLPVDGPLELIVPVPTEGAWHASWANRWHEAIRAGADRLCVEVEKVVGEYGLCRKTTEREHAFHKDQRQARVLRDLGRTSVVVITRTIVIEVGAGNSEVGTGNICAG